MNFVKTVNMQSTIAVGISLPKEIVKKIDSERGDIPRSRYVLRIVEKLYRKDKNGEKSIETTKNSEDSLDIRFSNPSSESQFQ